MDIEDVVEDSLTHTIPRLATVVSGTERELDLHLVPNYFWWLNCPTQTIGLTSLAKCIDYTDVKGSHSANKKTKFWIQQWS
jgi:hypothetical protein